MGIYDIKSLMGVYNIKRLMGVYDSINEEPQEEENKLQFSKPIRNEEEEKEQI